MAAIVTGSLTVTMQGILTPDTGFYAGKANDAQLRLAVNFRESGTTADKCDLRFVKRLTFMASTAQTIDLTAAVSDDGLTVNFAEIAAIGIKVNSTTDGASLTIDNAGGTNVFEGFLNSTGTFKVYPSTTAGNTGGFIWVAPNATGGVVDGTHKNLRLLPSAHGFTADVLILGRSV